MKSITRGLNANQVAIHSTDQYFFSNNRYLFDPKKLSINHEKNQQAFTNSLIKGVPLVICDNTNIEYWQMRPYLEAAKKYGYMVEVISIGLFNNSTKHHQYVLRNNHNIELSVVEAMAGHGL
ncbi:ATP-binding protein [Psychrosphaera sp.]|nr:ATP-binding protein [Psychrosphaera sp.]